MADRNLLTRVIDWFIPKATFKDRDLLLRSRLLVTISFLITIIWVPFVFQYGPVATILGLTSAVILLFMPFLFKRTGSIFWAGHIIILLMTFSNFYRAYWDGGYSAVMFWWNVVAPVVAVLLIGTKSGFFWLAINGIGVGFFFVLENRGVNLPGGGALSDEAVVLNTIALSLVLMITSLYLERGKNLVMGIRRDGLEKAGNLASDMQNIAKQIRANTGTIYQSSDQLNRNLKKMKEGAVEIEQMGVESATALNQGIGTIGQLSITLGTTVKRIKELEHGSEMIKDRGKDAEKTILHSVKAMEKINESRQEYELILQAITDIADSAHLLSLNAAIEAAKAGEYGKGFFVVVEEIRDLAQRSNDTVIDIRKVIKKSAFVLSRSKYVMVSIREVFDTVTSLIESMTDLIRELAVALEEQDIGIKEIARGTEEIARSGEQNASLVQELNRSIEDNSKTIQDLHQIAVHLEKQQVDLEQQQR
jgi:methyl-accepting chemotaxis protein-like sensor